jgi:hypothetical protein
MRFDAKGGLLSAKSYGRQHGLTESALKRIIPATSEFLYNCRIEGAGAHRGASLIWKWTINLTVAAISDRRLSRRDENVRFIEKRDCESRLRSALKTDYPRWHGSGRRIDWSRDLQLTRQLILACNRFEVCTGLLDIGCCFRLVRQIFKIRASSHCSTAYACHH